MRCGIAALSSTSSAPTRKWTWSSCSSNSRAASVCRSWLPTLKFCVIYHHWRIITSILLAIHCLARTWVMMRWTTATWKSYRHYSIAQIDLWLLLFFIKVNAGPMAYARAFLDDSKSGQSNKKVKELKEIFRCVICWLNKLIFLLLCLVVL